MPILYPKSNLHKGCLDCVKRNRVKQDIIDEDTGDILYRKGEFIIDCNGIPADANKGISDLFEQAGIPYAFTEEEVRTVAEVEDPVAWAANHLVIVGEDGLQPWVPQGATKENIERYHLDPTSEYYQELMVKCTAKRALYRLGRRSGKSWTLSVKALHKMVTKADYRILVITPYLSMLDNIFERTLDYLLRSPTIASSYKRFIKTPQRLLTLHNGSYMKGFTSNNDSIRGQAADMLIIDEADYLTTDDMSAIVAILSEHKDTILCVASTPSGARERFYNWDHDESFRSFHYPSMCRPLWDKRMEIEQKKENPGVKYQHEILGEYGEIDQGVFQHSLITDSLRDYSYNDTFPRPEWIYTMGIDWNPKHGTEIIVMGVNPTIQPLRFLTVDVANVHREGKTQLLAMQEVIRLNKKWNVEHIYADYGAGATQIEVLEELGSFAHHTSPDARLADIITAIDFGSKVEMRHPVTGELIKEYAKPAMVNNCVRFFEDNRINLSKYDTLLERQLRGYIIDKIGHNGVPKYAMISDDIDDHRLDAFMLAVFAFYREFTRFGTITPSTEVAITVAPGELVTFVNGVRQILNKPKASNREWERVDDNVEPIQDPHDGRFLRSDQIKPWGTHRQASSTFSPRRGHKWPKGRRAVITRKKF